MGRQRGYILILAIFLLGLLQLIALGFATAVPANINDTGRYYQETQAALTAQAGLQRTLAEISLELENGNEITDFTRQGPHTGDYSWSVEVEVNPGNAGTELIEVRAEGRLRGVTLWKTRTLVSRGSFAQYARFVEDYPPGVVWFTGGAQTVDGPIHSNSGVDVQAYPDFFPPTNLGPVLFQHGLRTVGRVRYQSGALGVTNPVNPNTGRIRNQPHYRRLYGRAGLREGVARVPLPDPVPRLRSSATGTAAIRLAGGGATLPATLDGGVLVDGNVNRFELRLVKDQLPNNFPAATLYDNPGAGANPLHLIEVGSRTFYVAEVRHSPLRAGGTLVPTGHTVVGEVGGGQPWLISGLPNGAVFVRGSLEGLAGINKDPHTLGVDRSSGVIRVADSLIRTDTPSHTNLLQNYSAERRVYPEVPRTGEHPLGLVCRDLELPPAARRHSALFIFASIYAAGAQQGGVRCPDRHTQPHAYAHFVGSVTEHTRDYTASIQTQSGWTMWVRFDPQLRSNAPPGFPVTSELKIIGTLEE